MAKDPKTDYFIIDQDKRDNFYRNVGRIMSGELDTAEISDAMVEHREMFDNMFDNYNVLVSRVNDVVTENDRLTESNRQAWARVTANELTDPVSINSTENPEKVVIKSMDAIADEIFG